ncbi:transmembrane protein 116 isoform X2 [Dunckerocampus dactyliophorus]|uniref:transmembrane protein 116 isoform X2 n=1 Tax=Dunckerocampus dactyliophorus TaxID=161453 RepID=UPI002406B13A|nr:transmembrane protein 116 isoform X2 [Dunckerocampus dactyliophorus]
MVLHSACVDMFVLWRALHSCLLWWVGIVRINVQCSTHSEPHEQEHDMEYYTDRMIPYKNFTGPHDWTELLEVVQWVKMLMALLSALGSASIIACMMSERRSGTSKVLLSVSDLLLALCWLLGGTLASLRCLSWYHLHTAQQVVCMASFFYTLNYVWSVYNGLRLRFSCGPHHHPGQFSKQGIWAANLMPLLCGVVPVLLMAPVFIQGSVNQCGANCSNSYRCPLMLPIAARQPIRACLVLRGYCGTIFLATFLFTLVSMMVLMGKARRVYRRVVMSHGYLGSQQQASFRSLDFRILAYPLVFALCWGPVACLVLMRVLMSSEDMCVAAVILYIAQAFTSPSQGILHCVLLACTRVWHAGQPLAWRHADTQTPLLRAQKTKKSYHT